MERYDLAKPFAKNYEFPQSGRRTMNEGKRISLFLLWGSFLLALIPAGPLEANPEEQITLGLDQAIQRALEFSPEIRETEYDLEVFQSRRQQADAAMWPQVELLGVAGPSNRARGNQIYSPDKQTDLHIDGVFGRADINLIQPLYTFGKISSLREAARHGIQYAQAKVNQKRGDIILRTKELYYGLLLAKTVRNHILEIKDMLEGATRSLEEKIEAGAPGVDEVDLFKLRAYLGQVDKYLHETEKGIALAQDALKATLGYEKGVDLDIVDRKLLYEEVPLEPLETYIARARGLRPEFVQAREGLLARQGLVDSAYADLFPQFFLAGFYSWAAASNRSWVKNPFIYDPLYHEWGGVVLGMRLGINFGITSGKINEAKAEYRKVQSLHDQAEMGIPVQVAKAYRELVEARKNVRSLEEAYQNARKWMVAASANYDLGIGEAKDLGDAVVAYGSMKADYYRSIYNEKMGWANLIQATGEYLKAQ
jgi:outer membrane protein TolC